MKAAFSRFLGAAPGRLDFAAHSHHPWPDVSYAAHERAWLDAADLVDDKWERVFGEVVPEAQGHVARLLGTSDPAAVALAPNTFELVTRLLSSLTTPVRVLTTGSEFHSFERLLRRLEEDGLADAERVPAEPYATFPDRFAEAALRGGHHLVFLSHVHYDSGYVVPDVAALVDAVPEDDTVIVIDGYHAFMALPVDIRPIESRAFYLTGGYKYAMAGEGACAMHCPKGYVERPRYTGWFASFTDLQHGVTDDRVPYAPGGLRFLGGTLDPTPWYRFNSVQRWLLDDGITVSEIHDHVRMLQARLLGITEGRDDIGPGNVVPGRDAPDRANFLTFRTPAAADLHAHFREAEVLTDWRRDRLRIGIGIYHDADDIDALVARLP